MTTWWCIGAEHIIHKPQLSYEIHMLAIYKITRYLSTCSDKNGSWSPLDSSSGGSFTLLLGVCMSYVTGCTQPIVRGWESCILSTTVTVTGTDSTNRMLNIGDKIKHVYKLFFACDCSRCDVWWLPLTISNPRLEETHDDHYPIALVHHSFQPPSLPVVNSISFKLWTISFKLYTPQRVSLWCISCLLFAFF